MLNISKTVLPEGPKLSFNQLQAILFLRTTGDLQRFNTYCDSCKMSYGDRDVCLSSITLNELNSTYNGK